MDPFFPEKDWKAVRSMRERMCAAERARDAIEPIITIGPFFVGQALGTRHGGDGQGAHLDRREEGVASIVAMCATPTCVSLIQYKNHFSSSHGRGSMPPPQLPVPDLLGHVAVLTSEGDVHVLEFVDSIASRTNMLVLPKVEIVATFSSGECGATCLSFHPVNTDDGIEYRSEKWHNVGETKTGQMLDYTSGREVVPLRVCIGHQSGTIVDYELVAMEIQLKNSANLATDNCNSIGGKSNGDKARQDSPKVVHGENEAGIANIKPVTPPYHHILSSEIVSRKIEKKVAKDLESQVESPSKKETKNVNSVSKSSDALERIAEIVSEREKKSKETTPDSVQCETQSKETSQDTTQCTLHSQQRTHPPDSSLEAEKTEICVTMQRGPKGTDLAQLSRTDITTTRTTVVTETMPDLLTKESSTVINMGMSVAPSVLAPEIHGSKRNYDKWHEDAVPKQILNPNPAPPWSPPPRLSYSDPRPHLVWRGTLDDPVRCISSLGWCLPGTNRVRDCDTTMPPPGKDVDTRLHQNFLAVGLVNRASIGGENSLSSTLEVVNIVLAESKWKEIVCQKARSNHEVGVPRRYQSVPLGECCVWPGIGMEIRDRWTWKDSEHGKCTPNVLNNEGTAETSNVAMTGSMCSFTGESPAFAASMTNGTVVISHSLANSVGNSDEEGKSMFTWGIAHDYNQIMLPNSCIGLALLDGSQVLPNHSCTLQEEYVSCCTRNGTVYIIPVTSPLNQGEPPEVSVYQLPWDLQGNDGNLIQYVQGFTAGYVRVIPWSDDNFEAEGEDTKEQLRSDTAQIFPAQPVYVHAWAGGLLDVYACGLSCSCNGQAICTCSLSIDPSDNIIDFLVENGTAQMLVNLLLSKKEFCELPKDDIWRGAWEECHNGQLEDAIVQAIKTNSENTKQIRKLLVLLSEK